MKISKFNIVFFNKERTKYLLMEREDDVILYIPAKRMYLKYLKDLEKRGFQIVSSPNADPVIFIKLKSNH